MAAGLAGLAAGEYVSVASQRDAERADVALERHQLASFPEAELDELTGWYIGRGVDPALARQVAVQLSAQDALTTHAREELGLADSTKARPVQAAVASAVSFALGAVLPVIALLVAPVSARTAIIVAVALVGLGVLGRLGAAVGGADWRRATARVMAGGRWPWRSPLPSVVSPASLASDPVARSRIRGQLLLCRGAGSGCRHRPSRPTARRF